MTTDEPVPATGTSGAPAAKKSAAEKTSGTEKSTPKKSTAKKSTAAKPAGEESTAASRAAGNDGEAVDVEFTDDHDLWDDDWSDLGSSWNEPVGERTGARGGGPDGVELFQNAMLELIAAARTALDTAEELVADPNAIGTAIESLRGLAVEAFRGGMHSARSAVRSDDPDDDFQTIRVDDD